MPLRNPKSLNSYWGFRTAIEYQRNRNNEKVNTGVWRFTGFSMPQLTIKHVPVLLFSSIDNDKNVLRLNIGSHFGDKNKQIKIGKEQHYLEINLASTLETCF